MELFVGAIEPYQTILSEDFLDAINNARILWLRVPRLTQLLHPQADAAEGGCGRREFQNVAEFRIHGGRESLRIEVLNLMWIHWSVHIHCERNNKKKEIKMRKNQKSIIIKNLHVSISYFERLLNLIPNFKSSTKSIFFFFEKQ